MVKDNEKFGLWYMEDGRIKVVVPGKVKIFKRWEIAKKKFDEWMEK